MSPKVLPYEPEWLEVTAQIWSRSYQASTVAVAGQGDVAELVERIPKEIDAGWSAWLAWRDGEAVGFLALKPKDQQLHQLFVLPESQGEGIGTMLLTHAKAELREGIWLSVFAENASARRFYERHGFAEGAHDKHPRTGQETIVYRWTPFID